VPWAAPVSGKKAVVSAFRARAVFRLEKGLGVVAQQNVKAIFEPPNR